MRGEEGASALPDAPSINPTRDTAHLATPRPLVRWCGLPPARCADSLHTSLTHFVAPDSYGVFLSLFLLAGVSIAGSSQRLGILAGALFLVFVPDLAERVNKGATGFIFGATMLACVYIGPVTTALRRRFWRPGHGVSAAPVPQPEQNKVQS